MKNEKVSNTLDDGLRTQCKGSANTVLYWEKKYKTWKGNDSQKVIFCGQISPLGIEVGKYRLIGFGELGLGMTGWFRAGIGYRF